MVRKRKNIEDKVQMPKEKEVEPEVSHPSQTAEAQSDCANPLVEKENTLGEKELTLVETENTLVEKVNLQPSMQANTAKSYSRMKKTRYHMAAVRRSDRINNNIVTAQHQDIEPMTEEVILDESQRQDEQVIVENQLPCPTVGEKSMEEKLDHISQLLEAQGKNIEEMMSKEPRKESAGDSPNMVYKNLYINCQKKNEALTKENRELLLKLEIALAKLEGFERGTRVSAEWMQGVRDITLMSNVTRTATEQAICNALSPQSKGRKAHEKKGG